MARDSVCALARDGGIYCWGNNTSKELGDDYPDHDVTEPFEGITDFDGTSLPAGFKVKAVPYPVKVELPNSLKATAIAAGDWAFCALADVTSAEDKHNLFCWGNDTSSVFNSIAEHLPYDPEKDTPDTEAIADIQKQYAKLVYYTNLFADNAEDNNDPLPEDLNWTCYVKDTDKKVKADEVSSFPHQ